MCSTRVARTSWNWAIFAFSAGSVSTSLTTSSPPGASASAHSKRSASRRSRLSRYSTSANTMQFHPPSIRGTSPDGDTRNETSPSPGSRRAAAAWASGILSASMSTPTTWREREQIAM